MPSFSCLVEMDARGLRLDRYVAERLRLLSRSQAQARRLEALLNGREVKRSRLLKGGERLELSWEAPEPPDLLPEDIPLDILYEDSRAAVINKPQGMVVHPGAGHFRGTLAAALLWRCLHREGAGGGGAGGGLGGARAQGPGGAGRPCIVHRLDKDTSGVIIAAWDEEALACLASQFKARAVRKTYAALVHGTPPIPAGKIETRIARDPRDRKRFAAFPAEGAAGRLSVTLYRVIRTWGEASLLLLRPKTGRTHQIRVHLRHLGNPILGDPLYGRPGGPFPQATLMLHARSLSIALPGALERSLFTAPLPPRFPALIEALDARYGEGGPCGG